MNIPPKYIRKNIVSSRELYNHFKEQYPELVKAYKITNRKFSEIARDYFSATFNACLTEGYTYVFPYGLGNIHIQRIKFTYKLDEHGNIKSKPSVDWGATRQLWCRDSDARDRKVLVYHTNKHSNGYYYRVFYNKNRRSYAARSPVRNLLEFDVVRGLQRSINPSVKAGTIYDK